MIPTSDPRYAMMRTQTFCLVALTVVASGYTLYYLQSVLLPFVIACFLVIGCRPILQFLQRRLKLHWFLAFLVTFGLGVGLLAAFAFFTWWSIQDLSQHSDAYERRITDIVNVATERFPKLFGDPDQPASPAPEEPDGEQKEQILDAAERSTQALQNFLDSLANWARQFLGQLVTSLTSLLSYAVLILIFVFFLLLGHSDRANTPAIIGKLDTQIRKYLVMKTVISALTGLVFGMVLWLFGVPLAIVFGFLAFLLNYIPNIGPLIANLLPVPFLILNSEMAPAAAITCFILISAVQFVSGNVIETRIMGKSFDVSPVVLLLALMFFGLIWGIIGMFLATPIVSIIKIVLQENRATRPVSELMAGRWETTEDAQGNMPPSPPA